MLKITWTPLAITLLCAFAHAQAPATTTTVAKEVKTPTATADANATPAAAAAAAATSTAEVKKEEAPSVKYSMGLGLSYSITAETQPDGTRSESVDYTFTPGLSYGIYRASVFTLYSQNLKDTAKNGSFIDPIFSFSRSSFDLSKYFKLGPSLSVTLPMSDSSKNNTELLYSIGGAASLYLQNKPLGIDNWNISYYVAYQRNFTKFATTNAGEPVTMQRIRQRINVGYKFTDSLSLSTRFQFDSKYSSEGIVRNDFLHFQTLSYSVNDTISLSMGHTNSGALLNGTNYDNNLKFYDEASSTYSAGIDVSL
ncbi:MAG: hypothetical protein K0R29_674 [Pseudobdellovibrio sp.]|jgi:hypothetical protein|nr:hypothetical protein [Pseudobdellovibrio sp.]